MMKGGVLDQCPVHGCPREKGNGALLCWPHWREVPIALRRRVHKLWAAYRDAPTVAEALDAATPYLASADEVKSLFTTRSPFAAHKERHRDAHPCF